MTAIINHLEANTESRDILRTARGLDSSPALAQIIEIIETIIHLQPSPKFRALIKNLEWQIFYELTKIRGTIHSRLVFGLGCIPMILIGIGLGIVYKGGHILSAFAVSCIPCAILAVGIVSGKQIVENPGSSIPLGMAVMWTAMGLQWMLALLVLRRMHST